jgi:7,8-dihydropterin-6-yl-methyl-4-(beta-D-ribofuranosyl)aminobenzene 5'-phosphate synthase
MELRITTLSENTAARPGFLAAWGLSILVEVDELKILLDAGQSIIAVHNATLLGIDLCTIDKIVLSHGHSDHTGGLRGVLGRMRKEVEIIAHPDIWAPKYICFPGTEKYNYIGIPFRREELENLGASFTLTREPMWLREDTVITGEIPMKTEYEQVDPINFVKEGTEFHLDPLLDDRAVIIKTQQGLVVILGCAHRGTINTLRYAQELTGVESIYAVIGGTHLARSSEEQLELTIAELREMGVQKLGALHCTGLPATARLAQEFGEGLLFNNAGVCVSLP